MAESRFRGDCLKGPVGVRKKPSGLADTLAEDLLSDAPADGGVDAHSAWRRAHITTESKATALLKRDQFGKEAVAVTEASFPPGAVIARKIEKEESGARLKMR